MTRAGHPSQSRSPRLYFAPTIRLRRAVILPALLILACHRLLTELKHVYVHPPYPYDPSRLTAVSLNDAPENTGIHKRRNRVYKEITFTDLGWFQKDAQQGLKVARSWASREFMDAVLAHERFNQSAWRDLSNHPDLSRPILTFLDIDTCNYLHYPHFGGDRQLASDMEGGRTPFERHAIAFAKVCPAIDKALQSPAMAAPESRLIVLSCEPHGPHFAENCTGANRSSASSLYSKVVVGHLSAHKSQVHSQDFGIPTMPVKSVVLNETQVDYIESCAAARRVDNGRGVHDSNVSRPFLFSFLGRARKNFPQFHKYWKRQRGKNGVVAAFGGDHYKHNPNNLTNSFGGKVLKALPPEKQAQDLYYKMLQESIFGGAPRGDNLYSVRFSELLSAATIPVLYSDGWIMPYNKDVVDWSDLVVMLPQKNVSQTMDILESMTEQEVCQRQRRILAFYKEFMADSHGQLRAILRQMDKRLNQAPNEIVHYTAAPDR